MNGSETLLKPADCVMLFVDRPALDLAQSPSPGKFCLTMRSPSPRRPQHLVCL
jgi:hypothetical protein